MAETTYAILGTGALGGYYGAKLQRAGLEVHFLLRSDYEHVAERGLVVDSKDGDFVLPEVHAWRDVREMPRCDVVCVAIKATQNHLLPKLLPKLVKEEGVVLVLQNGLGVEEQAAAVVGPDRVIGGLCFLCANKTGAGHIHHLDYGSIRLGEYREGGKAAGVTERMRAIEADFARAGIPIQLSEDLTLARWQKLVWNIPYNGLSVVLNATTDQLMRDSAARALVEALMAEVARGAEAFGRTIDGAFIEKMLTDTLQMKPYRTSMKVDYDLGRAMEVEAMYGQPLRAARERGVELPRIEMLYQQLKFIDDRNRQKETHG